jgi:glycosyltransferase involved in cell wall biosynthesis
VPFQDVLRYVDRCIESLLHQSFPRTSFELLFVDNNSSDGSRAAVAARPEIRLLHEPRQGVYAARNRALKEARGDILAFTDPDCRVEPDWLGRIVAAMQSPEVGIVLGSRSPATASGLLKLVAAYEAQKVAHVTSCGIEEVFFGHTNNMAVRRQVMEQVGPFVEMPRGGDTVFVRRAVDVFGVRIVRYCPEINVEHLEVTTLGSYYRKLRIYGESNERVAELVRFRPLTNRERWRVFRDTLQRNHWSAMRGAVLLALLIPGMLCYEWGRRRATTRRSSGVSPGS